MINAYPQNNVHGAYGNAWWGIYPPYQMTPIAPQSVTSAPQTQPQNEKPREINGVAFVQGEDAAITFIVPNGKTFLLFDTLEDRIYFKSADIYGAQFFLNDFWLTKTKPEPTQTQAPAQTETPAPPEYATKADLDEIREQVAELRAKRTGGRPRKAEPAEETEVDE